MENFEIKKILPEDYKSVFEMLYYSNYKIYNRILCTSFCCLWMGSVTLVLGDTKYSIILICFALVASISQYLGLKKKVKDHIGRQRNYAEKTDDKIIFLDEKILIKSLINHKERRFKYSDVKGFFENKDMYIIKLRFNTIITLYKNRFIFGDPSELRRFLFKKQPKQKAIYAKRFISNDTISISVALIFFTVVPLLVNMLLSK